MNKIYVVNDILDKELVNDDLNIFLEEKNDFLAVNTLHINIKKDTELWIEYNSLEDTKLNIIFEIDNNVKASIYELRKGSKTKVQYKYYLNEYAFLRINKFYNAKKVREVDIVYLNGIGASIETVLKTIAKKEEKYDMMVYHNSLKTNSHIINHGITDDDGSITFNVTSIVESGKTKCVIDQQNRIINLNDRKCKINPNLFIDEFDVEANHGALIGKFRDGELFYLQSRGITKKDAIALLTVGFLCSHITNEELLNIIKEEI